MRGLQGFEALLDGQQHQITHHGTADALVSDGVPTDDFPTKIILAPIPALSIYS
jgi:hypothetical protein